MKATSTNSETSDLKLFSCFPDLMMLPYLIGLKRYESVKEWHQKEDLI